MLSQTGDDKSQQYCENLLFSPLEGGAKSFRDKIGRPFAASRAHDFMGQVFSCNVPSCSTKHAERYFNFLIIFYLCYCLKSFIIKRCCIEIQNEKSCNKRSSLWEWYSNQCARAHAFWYRSYFFMPLNLYSIWRFVFNFVTHSVNHLLNSTFSYDRGGILILSFPLSRQKSR